MGAEEVDDGQEDDDARTLTLVEILVEIWQEAEGRLEVVADADEKLDWMRKSLGVVADAAVVREFFACMLAERTRCQCSAYSRQVGAEEKDDVSAVLLLCVCVCVCVCVCARARARACVCVCGWVLCTERTCNQCLESRRPVRDKRGGAAVPSRFCGLRRVCEGVGSHSSGGGVCCGVVWCRPHVVLVVSNECGRGIA